MKDLYNILGLEKNASDDEIKKAYRKLVLRYHPDRQGGKSKSEKKAAEEKFKEVSWAYDILSNPEKKQRYDQFGITDDQQMGEGFNASDIFKHFMGGMFGNMDDEDDIFSNFFNRNRKQKGQNIVNTIYASIEDLLIGIHKNIDYNVQVKCSKCNGTGGEGVETCRYCNGTGMITETMRQGFSILKNSYPCKYCNGTGKTIKHKCSACGGTGFKTKTQSIYIDIPAGFENGYQYVIKGKGCEAKNSSFENGDLIINVVYNFNTGKYIRQGNKIYEKIEIPYYDAIIGAKKELTLPNNEKITITIPEYSNNGTVINSGKYFGGLSYNYVVTIKMPTYIRDSERKLLEKIQKENN